MRHFGRMPQMCANTNDPGYRDLRPRYTSWTNLETTLDQLRIEEVLAKLARKESRILHVGIGNSKLAVRFAPHVAEIVGMTVSPDEVQLAQGLGINNYNAILWNKHNAWQNHAKQFDVIIDNNPATYACCFHHMMTMFNWYAETISDDGVILTDSEGLAHSIRRSRDQRFSLGYGAWRDIGERLNLQALDLNGTVYALTRNPHSARIEAVLQGTAASRFAKRMTGSAGRKTKKLVERLKRLRTLAKA